MPSQRQNQGSGRRVATRPRAYANSNGESNNSSGGTVGASLNTAANKRTPSSSLSRANRTGRTQTRARSNTSRRQTRTLAEYSPTKKAEATATGIGMLEAEFFAAMGLLVLLAFSDSSTDYGSKIMSVMKRGTLVILLFFILALLSTIGPSMEKITKAFGALVIVGILITSPITTVLADVDDIIKNDWVGTSETGSTADTGTQNATSSASSSGSSVLSTAATDALNKVAPGLGSFIALQEETATGTYATGRLLAALATGNGTAIENAAKSLGYKANSIGHDLLATLKSIF